MATTPRAGIINLDFKDTTQIGKNIHDNDPWGNLLATGIDVLGDRERDILYRRALAQAQGLEAPDETSVGDLVTGAGKKIGEGASWLKDKWDRLDIRSPFEEKLSESTKTETPITETPSERGSREMIGYAPNKSPIETDKYRTNLKAPEMADVEPNDEVSFGFNQDVGQGEEKASPIIPFATGEQTPEQIGVKVDYGTSEPKTDYTKLRSPFAMREKAEGSEAVSPVAGAEGTDKKLETPDRAKSQMEAWSEMYRLKPEQAKFDWGRIAPKGSGASGILQARLEHDRELNIEIGNKAIQLRKDMLENNWTTESPEYLEAYGDIVELNNQKFTPSARTELDRLIAQSESAKRLDYTGSAQDLQKKRMDFDKEKEQTNIDKEAYGDVKSVFDKLMDKRYTTPAIYGKIATDLKLAVKDPNNINEAAIKEAIKSFINSIDNSVVMSFEAASFADQSTLGEYKAKLKGLLDDNIYSPDRLQEIWNIMTAYITTYNTAMDNLASQTIDLYTKRGGSRPETVKALANAYKANTAVFDNPPDFSVVKPWWDRTRKSLDGSSKGSTNLEQVIKDAESESPNKGGSTNTGYASEEDL